LVFNVQLQSYSDVEARVFVDGDSFPCIIMGEERSVNYSTPSDGGSALIIVSVVLSVVQIVFVAARFYTRYMQRMKCGLDDYVMLFALVRRFPCDLISAQGGANKFTSQAGSLAKAILYIVCKHSLSSTSMGNERC
jgi:hypothetical protein